MGCGVPLGHGARVNGATRGRLGVVHRGCGEAGTALLRGGAECVRVNETGLFEVSCVEVTGRMPVPLLARASIRRFWQWGHRQDACGTFGSGIEVEGGVGVAAGKCGEAFAFRWCWG